MNKRFRAMAMAAVLSGGAAQADTLQQYLEKGEFAEAASEYGGEKGNEQRFVSALCGLSQSLESVAQQNYRYGLSANGALRQMVPGLPVMENPNPESIDYLKFRSMIEKLHVDLTVVEELLAAGAVDEEFHLLLDLTKMRIDVNSDGVHSEDESMVAMFMQAMGGRGQVKSSVDMSVDFDRSDMLWLHGYANVMLGATDLVLAHDFEDVFEPYARFLYAKPDTKLSKLLVNQKVGLTEDGIANAISMVHQMRMKVIEPKRLIQARQHFLNMTELSADMWVSIQAETDDRREWLPSPKQTSVTGVKISEEMVEQWGVFLNEARAILNGEKLLPHWRFSGVGVNLKRAIEESRETDVVLWVTGEAALPFLEKGEVTDRKLWREMDRAFGGNLLGMSFWIN